MFCKKCGHEYNEGQMFCTGCGEALTEANRSQPQGSYADEEYSGNENTIKASKSQVRKSLVADKFVSAFSNNLFMVACILTTVSVCISFIVGVMDVISVLYAIFMWLIYGDAKRGIANSKYMRFISGTVYAVKILLWVVFGAGAVSAFLSLVASSAAAVDFNMTFSRYTQISEVLGVGIALFMFLFFAFGAATALLLNILFYKPAHKFAQSIYTSVDTGVMNLENVSKTKNGIIVLLVIKVLSVLVSDLNSGNFIRSGCLCATYILIYLWLKKHFNNNAINNNAN